MIDIQDAIRVHEVLIDKFGGGKGIRDLGLLESALSRPFQTFDKKELYSDPIEKAGYEGNLCEIWIVNPLG